MVTVKELRDILANYPEDLPVWVECEDGYYSEFIDANKIRKTFYDRIEPVDLKDKEVLMFFIGYDYGE